MTTPVHRSEPNRHFEAIRAAIPADAHAVAIYCRSKVHWRTDKRRAEEVSFAFHSDVDIASKAFQSAAQTNVYDWGALFLNTPDHGGWYCWDTFA